jgi:hypothetical protein
LGGECPSTHCSFSPRLPVTLSVFALAPRARVPILLRLATDAVALHLRLPCHGRGGAPPGLGAQRHRRISLRSVRAGARRLARRPALRDHLERVGRLGLGMRLVPAPGGLLRLPERRVLPVAGTLGLTPECFGFGHPSRSGMARADRSAFPPRGARGERPRSPRTRHVRARGERPRSPRTRHVRGAPGVRVAPPGTAWTPIMHPRAG